MTEYFLLQIMLCINKSPVNRHIQNHVKHLRRSVLPLPINYFSQNTSYYQVSTLSGLVKHPLHGTQW